MKASIVTLAFNQAPFLERAINSVINQDYDDIEYIVVDPGSTDGSHDIIERYRDHIAKVVYEPDKGPAEGLNNGFAAATGDIFAYINGDDAFLPGAIREAVEEFKSHQEADVVIGHGYIIDAQSKVLRTFRSAPVTPWRFAYGGSIVMQQSTFIRRKAFEAVGGFNIDNGTSWDAELVLQLARNDARFHYVDRYWSVFTIHPESISGSQRMAEESRFNHRRYFTMVMKREPRSLDLIVRRFVWLIRWAGDPVGVLCRLRDKVFGPPRPSFPWQNN